MKEIISNAANNLNVTIAPRSMVEGVSRIMFYLSFHCARNVKRQRMHSSRKRRRPKSRKRYLKAAVIEIDVLP